MRTTSKFLAMLFSLVFMLSLLPVVAAGAEIVIDVGNGAIPGGWGWSYADGLFTVRENVTLTGTTTVNRVVVAPGTAATITLRDVTIDRSGDESLEGSACAFDMSGAMVDLILEGDNTLASGLGFAGLQAPAGAVLTIGGAGKLTAKGGGVVEGGLYSVYSKMSFAGAGIGSGKIAAHGAITINGGTVVALGGRGMAGGAGLGGGAGAVDNSGSVTITGGTVEARGAGGAAGIGGGEAGGGGTVVISGGHVTAIGGSGETGSKCGGAGIGGGGGGDTHPAAGVSGTITITGDADVTATGGNGAPFADSENRGGAGGAGIGSGGAGSVGGGGVGTIIINNTGSNVLTSGTGGSGRNGAPSGVGHGGKAGGAGANVAPGTTVIYRSVQVTQTDGGTIVPLGGDADAIPHGASKTFVFIPDEGYQIAYVVVDGLNVGTPASRTIPNITNDSRSITARFFDGVTPSLRGDANVDNNVNAADAAAILRYLVELTRLTPLGLVNAKVTAGTNPVSAADAARILRWLVELDTLD
ncbi:MAG: hypothetical protein FWE69_01105 [Clostridiales bacterium]|nr:hypothetical protein [Clostridiales bacterium]